MNFIKQYRIPLIVGIFFVLFFAASYWYSMQKSTNPGSLFVPNNNSESTAPRTLPISLQNIVPASTQEKDVLASLGNPVSKQQQGEFMVEKFTNPNSANRQHQVILKENVVQFVKEIVSYKDTKKIEDITKIYGKPEIMLYGPDQEIGVFLYAYPDKGIAYLANQQFNNNTLFEVWYFSPISKEQFMTSWASGYSTSPSGKGSF